MDWSHNPLSEGDRYDMSFLSLFDRSSARIAHVDARLRLMESNAGFAEAFGTTPEELTDHALLELLHSSVQQRFARQFVSLTRGERSRFTDRAMFPVGAGLTGVDLTGIAVVGETGLVESVIVLLESEECGLGSEYPVRTPRPLSKIEAHVLEGVAAGMSTVQLAAHLFLSRGGVEYHVSALMKGLKAANRSSLVAKAYSNGLLSVGTWPPRVVQVRASE